MSAHTPGPWSVGGKYTNKTVLLNAAGESIASGGNNLAVTGEVLEASLILASAAPEMLEACIAMKKQLEKLSFTDEKINRALRKAFLVIDKATGGAS